MVDAFKKFANPIGDDGAIDPTEIVSSRNFDDDDDGARAVFDDDNAARPVGRKDSSELETQEQHRANSRSVQKFVEEQSKPCR